MNRTRYFLALLIIGVMSGLFSSGVNAEQLRTEITKSVQTAQELMNAKKYTESLAKLSALDAITDKSPDEVFLIERTRVAVASASGDEDILVKSLEYVIASNKLSAADSIEFNKILSSKYYGKKDYAKTVTLLTRYVKDGGGDPILRTRLTRAYYFNNQFPEATELLRTDMQADEALGKAPSEEQLRLLASCALKLKDNEAYMFAMEKFVTYYPQTEYWTDLINRLLSRPKFPERLGVDVYRLMLATGQVTTAKDFLDMAHLVQQYSSAAEAKTVLDLAFKAGVLGTGADASIHQRQLEFAEKASAAESKTMIKDEAALAKNKDNESAFSLGYAFVAHGEFDKGIGIMEGAISSGDLRRPEDAKLHLGVAYMYARRKADAIKILKTVQGKDGTADLARYWVIYLNNSKP